MWASIKIKGEILYMKNFRQRVLEIKEGFMCTKLYKRFFMIISTILLYCLGRYGKVVTKKDWDKIRESSPEKYREILSKKSIGYCYYYSREIALYLEDAELMYCSIIEVDGTNTAHSVILKNNCVYDTNERKHFDFKKYTKKFRVNVYKIFFKNEYQSDDFYDNIRDDFIRWCAERNVYCNPQ